MTAIRVLIADDDALVRAGLTMMLGEFDDIEAIHRLFEEKVAYSLDKERMTTC